MEQENIIINAEFDLAALRASIENVDKIEDAEDFFNQLTEVIRVKAEANDILDRIKSVEAEAKGLINAKAKALYGDDWQAVKGHGFKITRSNTGAVYDITGKPSPKFLVVKKTVDSKAVDEYITTHDGKLPAGIDYNPKRGEQLRITAVKNEDS